MRKGLIRRTIRRARTSRPATVADTTGKRYRVIPADDPETAAYADPPRKWPRVATMAGTWALVLALGAWIAPAFAASGNEENQDPRDETASSASNAAWRYLRYGASEDLDRAEAVLCDGAEPELAPGDLDAIRQSYADELGGITRVDVETGDPVPTSDGIAIAGTVSYVSEGTQRHEEFVVTVQEHGGTYCVSDANQPGPEVPTASPDEGASPEVDFQEVATDFLRAVVADRNPATAEAMQCSAFTGITAQDLDDAIAEWVAVNGATTGYLNGISPADGVGAFETEIVLQGELNQESFTFQIAVEGDCVASLDGGDALMNAAD
ncbi:hypothetical protein ACFQS3_20135 [Glycomyces mayteni]|uniref:DUF4878 domain-containing protein n=1 Tax=Glycomyces mayteni TaxID=543887 RepID=A0ABW2DD63_9ACTN|nr:hypothetical protein GCM10025732_05420 [Glycomyces mayteni]